MVCIKYRNFLGSCIFNFLRPAQRFDDSKHIKITRKAACHGITEHTTVPFGAEVTSGHLAKA